MDARRLGLMLVAGGAAAWALATIVVVLDWTALDLAVDGVVAPPQDRTLFRILADVSALGTPAVAGLVAVVATVVCWRNRGFAAAGILLVAAGAGGVSAEVLKQAHERPFPSQPVVMVDLESGAARTTDANGAERSQNPDHYFVEVPRDPDGGAGFPHGKGTSFPSGHVVGGLPWALAFLLTSRATPRRGVRRPGATVDAASMPTLSVGTLALAALPVLLIGVVRIVQRAHWFTDVVASWGLVAFYVGLAVLASQRLGPRA